MPYDWYNYIDQKYVFFLAQHYEKYKGTNLFKFFKTKGIFLDNGAWIGDGGKAMDAEQYSDIVEDLRPTFAVVPDKLGSAVETKKLVEEFIKCHFFTQDVTYVLPLQGRTMSDIIGMYDWYREVIPVTNVIFGLSKGMVNMKMPNRFETIEMLRRYHDLLLGTGYKFHLFGYNFGELKNMVGTTSISWDTKLPIKKALGDLKYEKYYDIKWKDVPFEIRDIVMHLVGQFRKEYE